MLFLHHESSFMRLFSYFSCLSEIEAVTDAKNLSKAGRIVEEPSSTEVSAITRVVAPFGGLLFLSRLRSDKWWANPTHCAEGM